MRTARLPRALLFLTIGACSSSSSPAGPPGRIVEPVDPTEVVVVAGNMNPLVNPGDDAGRMDGATLLGAIGIELSLGPAEAEDLSRLLSAQRDRWSPSYHAWLTPDEYGARFGASPSDLAKIIAWIEKEGLTVQGVARGRTVIAVAGTVARVEQTFHTELHRYRVGDRSHFALAREPSIPKALSGVVVGLSGLDDFSPRPLYTAGAQHAIAPADFATVYDVAGLYARGIDGTGMTVGVVGATYYTPADVTTFRSKTGLAPIQLEDVFVPNSGVPTFIDPTAVGEAELDIELAGAVARNAKIVYVHTGGGAGTGIRDALAYAVDNHVADIVSISWGGCEKSFSAAGVTALQNIGKQANAQGMTVLAGAGDSGAGACDVHGTPLATKGVAVDLPATLPEFTAVGGTELDEAGGADWSPTNGPNLGSVPSPIPEIAWNDSAALNGLWATGGGASTLFSKPSWQVGAGVPNDGHRDIPDVSLAASGHHDGLLVYFSGPAADNGDGWYFVGGTSVSAPSFAGILALVEQANGKGGLGNVNPRLYTLAARHPAAFHDVTSGNNVVPCKPGTTSCPATAPFQYGFTAGPGYDLTTGLGSVDAAVLLDAWLACEADPSCEGPGLADAGADAAPEKAADASVDAAPEKAADAGADAAPEKAADASVDAAPGEPADADVDVSADADVDAALEAPSGCSAAGSADSRGLPGVRDAATGPAAPVGSGDGGCSARGVGSSRTPGGTPFGLGAIATWIAIGARTRRRRGAPR